MRMGAEKTPQDLSLMIIVAQILAFFKTRVNIHGTLVNQMTMKGGRIALSSVTFCKIID